MLRPIDKFLVAAVVILAAGEGYLFMHGNSGAATGPAGGPPGLFVPPPIPNPANMPFFGTLSEMSEHALSVKSDAAGKEAKYTLDEHTEIIDHAPLDAKKMEAAREAFAKAMKSGRPVPPPLPFTEKKIPASDLKPGDKVTVFPDTQNKGAAIKVIREIPPEAGAAPPIPPAPGIPPVPVPHPAPSGKGDHSSTDTE